MHPWWHQSSYVASLGGSLQFLNLYSFDCSLFPGITRAKWCSDIFRAQTTTAAHSSLATRRCLFHVCALPPVTVVKRNRQHLRPQIHRPALTTEACTISPHWSVVTIKQHQPQSHPERHTSHHKKCPPLLFPSPSPTPTSPPAAQPPAHRPSSQP